MFDPVVVEAAGLPDSVRSVVRRRCGYGCVRCGVTIVSYVSVPEDGAAATDADSLGLFCPNCLARLRGQGVDAAQYRALMARPIARDADFDRSHMPYHLLLPEIHAGGPVPVHDTAIPVAVGDQVPLTFSPPLHGMGATRLSVHLGEEGEPALSRVIDANVWNPEGAGWRFAQRGARYEITRDGGKARLELAFPTSNRVEIRHLLTWVGSRRIELTPDWLEVDGQRMVNALRSGQLIGYRA